MAGVGSDRDRPRDRCGPCGQRAALPAARRSHGSRSL